MNLLDLSESVFCIVHTFITTRPTTFAQNPDDNLNQYDFDATNDPENSLIGALQDQNWRDFLNTTLKLQQLKRKTVFFYFNHITSMKYFSNRFFRAFILHEVITNVCDQLGFQ
jgi:hypothetical protein